MILTIFYNTTSLSTLFHDFFFNLGEGQKCLLDEDKPQGSTSCRYEFKQSLNKLT